jgi:hypothetical protein
VATTIDIDRVRAASHRNMIEHLTGPYQAGAAESELAISGIGEIVVDWQTRAPLLLVAPAQPLDEKRLRLTARPSGATADVVLEFAPYTEAGAFLPLHAPALNPANPSVAPFTITLKKLEQIDPELLVSDPANATVTVATSGIATLLQAQLVEGVLGRVLYLLGAEEQRLRRQGREIAAMRVLGQARDDALDRLGAELGVPRFADRYKKGSALFQAERERDADYRRRLGMYTPLLLRSRKTILQLLNGPGAAASPNAGPIGELAPANPSLGRSAYQGRFELVEEDNDLAVGIHLIAAGDPAYRANFFKFIRAVHLIWPKDNAAANDVHGARFLPKIPRPSGAPGYPKETREDGIRRELRKVLTFSSFATGTEPAIAPMLALALIRAGRVIKALGGPSPWEMYRAQLDDGGSRYELGLGADMRRFSAAELNAMASKHAQLVAADPEFKQVADPDPYDPGAKGELQGLLKEMSPISSASDPDGRWLLEPCGIRTVHRIPKPSAAPWSLVYVSHFPTYGLTVSLEPPAQSVAIGGWSQFASGNFKERSNTNIFGFEGEAGAGRVLVFDDGGQINEYPRETLWGIGWSHALGGKFSQDNLQQIFLYSRSKGEARFYRFGDDAAPSSALAPKRTGLPKTWTQIVGGRFGFEELGTGIFAFDAESGQGTFYSTDGSGSLNQVADHPGLRKTWSEVIPVTNAAGKSDLFFYDAETGDGALYLVDEEGGITLSGGRLFRGLKKGCTHVVAGYFAEDPTGMAAAGAANYVGEAEIYVLPRQSILFYDAESGEAEVRDQDMALINAIGDLGKDWTSITAGRFPHEVEIAGLLPADGLILYNRLSGTIEAHQGDGAGGFALLRRHVNQPKSLAHQVAARYHAPGDPGGNVVLEEGLKAAGTEWTAAGHQPWTVLSRSKAEDAWHHAVQVGPGDPGAEVLDAAGLPRIGDPQAVAQRLDGIPQELVAAFELDQAEADQVLNANTATKVATAAALLRTLADLLDSQWITSALPIITDQDKLVIVAGMTPLPLSGSNLFQEPSARFRWYLVPIEGQAGEIRPTGSRTELSLAEPGLSAVIAIGTARSGLTDPYEYRVELPEGKFLSMGQYEYLMNLLEHTVPAGAQVNTYSIRRGHVDVAEDGSAAPLDPEISRTYRAFRRLHHRGESSVEARPTTT